MLQQSGFAQCLSTDILKSKHFISQVLVLQERFCTTTGNDIVFFKCVAEISSDAAMVVVLS